MKIKFGYKELELPDSINFVDLCNHIEVEFGIPKKRQRLKTDSGEICSDKTEFKNKTIIVKDLGPQFSYRGVFILEYLGPILIVSVMKFFNRGYGNTSAIYAWILHFLKENLKLYLSINFLEKLCLYLIYIKIVVIILSLQF